MPLNHQKYFELTDEQFKLLGKCLIEFSNIENLLGQILTRLLLTPDFLGRTYTDTMSISTIQRSIDTALEIQNHRYGYSIISRDLCIKIKDINKEVENLRQIRNKFAHYCWSRFGEEKIFGTSFSGKVPNPKKPNADSATLTNDEILDVYNNAYRIVGVLSDLVNALPLLEEGRELKNILVYPKSEN